MLQAIYLLAIFEPGGRGTERLLTRTLAELALLLFPSASFSLAYLFYPKRVRSCYWLIPLSCLTLALVAVVRMWLGEDPENDTVNTALAGALFAFALVLWLVRPKSGVPDEERLTDSSAN